MKQPQLFSQHEHALEKEFELCPECGCELSIKNSKHGPFLGCCNYPVCGYSRPLAHHEAMEEQLIDGSCCPLCGHELALKKGRYGIFIGCSNYPQCHHIEHQSQQQEIACPQCQEGHLAQRISRYGKTFYACDSYPKCKYVVNYQPLNKKCPDCGWGVLIEKKGSSGHRELCPQKGCGYKKER
jgi:putative DNA topoisomerase